ncbi:MAG TPA: D-tagatose-bisphosphate aldolase, class II, non-catalytic subunit [Actinomycetes bacterium]|nr:D-tagatose-bisphosphate aldolase, class II, non-catalytic subunit [Actinomycetes bacterium]
MTSHPIDELVEAQHAGNSVGVTSVCSAHPLVLAETLKHGVEGSHVVLIEATCNQVNQDGGYTGMRPSDFRALVERLAGESGIDASRVLLGGDHLGPNPWSKLAAEPAMAKAAQMVREYVSAGYSKMHLDTSMKCADDPVDAPLAQSVIAERAAQLASIAEQAAADSALDVLPRYVIGTEVPVPGGAHAGDDGIHVTTPDDVAETIELTRAAFLKLGLDAAWERVRAVVTQPGVEFSDTELHDYNREAAKGLSNYVESQRAVVFEAHSTDYQTASALRALVEDHFAILKVGPGLTFALREGIFALSYIEDVLLGEDASQVRRVLDDAMVDNPSYWQSFYSGDDAQQRFARQFSRSDRSRYYWTVPAVENAIQQLMANLQAALIPQELLSQFLPVQYERVRNGEVSTDPEALVRDKVREVLNIYLSATTPSP